MLISPQNSQKIMRSGIFLDPNSGLNGNGILGYHFRLWRNVQFAQASIGSYSYTLSSLNLASCGNYCSIAHAVNFANPHPVDRLTTSPLTNFDPAIDNVFHDFGIKKEFDRYPYTKIGSDVWIGSNVTIKCGVKIHDGAIIGAGAVVTKDVPPFAVMGGVSATIIRMRFPALIIARIMRLKWFNYDWAGFELEWDKPEKALDAMERHIEEGTAKTLRYFEYAANATQMQLREIPCEEGLKKLAAE